MRKRCQQLTVVLIVAALVTMPLGVAAQDEAPVTYKKDHGAGLMMADLVFGRTLGLAAMVVGTGFFIISLPFSATGGNTDMAAQRLVADPARYTFQRPLGDF
jgi:hypothetical protein